MALLRILIDGYSLLHHWPSLAPGRPRHSAQAREALLARLRLYVDAKGVPVTVVFDGAGAPPGTPGPDNASGGFLEVLFSGPGRTADDLIERAAARLAEFGTVLVVTNDRAERDTVSAVGGFTTGCEPFRIEVENTLDEFRDDLKHYNARERKQYRRPR